jgi:hypothetical protein
MSQGPYSGRCMTCGHDHSNDRTFAVAASFSVEIDEVRQALSQAYFLVTGRSPAFSETFGTKEALADIDDACRLLRASVANHPAADESAKPYYLIERQGSSPTVWWKGPVWADVTPDAAKAHRFATRAEADTKIRIWTDHSLFVSEHMDIEGAPSNGMEQAFSSSAMGRRDDLALADRHAETPLLLELLGVPLIDGIANYCIRIKLERALAAQSEPATVASKDAVTLSYPEELTPDLREVLGWMCFQCISLAQCMRADGVEIATRAEDEQAVVLHWLTKFVLKHGTDWRPHAGEALKAMRERVAQRDASKAEGKS